jgi:hypothetical protein
MVVTIWYFHYIPNYKQFQYMNFIQQFYLIIQGNQLRQSCKHVGFLTIIISPIHLLYILISVKSKFTDQKTINTIKFLKSCFIKFSLSCIIYAMLMYKISPCKRKSPLTKSIFTFLFLKFSLHHLLKCGLHCYTLCSRATSFILNRSPKDNLIYPHQHTPLLLPYIPIPPHAAVLCIYQHTFERFSRFTQIFQKNIVKLLSLDLPLDYP